MNRHKATEQGLFSFLWIEFWEISSNTQKALGAVMAVFLYCVLAILFKLGFFVWAITTASFSINDREIMDHLVDASVENNLFTTHMLNVDTGAELALAALVVSGIASYFAAKFVVKRKGVDGHTPLERLEKKKAAQPWAFVFFVIAIIATTTYFIGILTLSVGAFVALMFSFNVSVGIEKAAYMAFLYFHHSPITLLLPFAFSAFGTSHILRRIFWLEDSLKRLMLKRGSL